MSLQWAAFVLICNVVSKRQAINICMLDNTDDSHIHSYTVVEVSYTTIHISEGHLNS